MARLGDILVDQRAIARDALETQAARARVRIGDFLAAHGAIDGRALARALAARFDLPHLESLDAENLALAPRDLPKYLRECYLPYRHDGALVMATPQPSPELAQQLGAPLAVISRRDFAAGLFAAGSQALSRRAKLGLRRLHPGLVADTVMLPHQLRAFAIYAVAFAAAALLAPVTVWRIVLVATNVFYLAVLLFKLQLCQSGLRAERGLRKLGKALELDAAALDAATLPVYTLLVPLYRESRAVMARLIANLDALDYPKEKLDIKLICEADDLPTIDALKSLAPPPTMEILRVPPSQPRTKPKACNVALAFARGEFTVIYDAEDAPAPDQLRRAVALFAQSGPDVACLQTPLNYYNRSENLLTALFAIEYSVLFHILLPALEAMKLPIPLGGTSNHLRTAALVEAGGWDPFNVTEDADLGVRLHYLGRHTRILPSLTLEEAPIALDAWMQQRTRWIKGYIQTWLVYMRDPGTLRARLGRRAYYGFQFFIGAPALTFLLAPFFWITCAIAALGLMHTHLSGFMLSVCLVSLAAGVVSHWLLARAALVLERWADMRIALLVFPFYWLLHSFASIRALIQLLTAPHYWEKTTHGVSRLFSISSPWKGED
ncbi:MAG: glycosyltransferase family 2 protein [Alphaproteobacteria bacterium]